MDVTVPLHSEEEERALMGPRDAHARAVRNRFGVKIQVRKGRLLVEGEEEDVSDAVHVMRALLARLRDQGELDESAVREVLDNGGAGQGRERDDGRPLPPGVECRSAGQQRYVRAIGKHTITFAIGPAGTGKTYLAAALAVAALRRRHFRKLVLVRPAVEAGEHLGFLPGDLIAKVNPYLRPLYDSLSAHLEPGKLKLFLESDVIEIAPLAYMRGRTLDEAFIILDEAQNTTPGQMKMFLTRMGQGSKMVVTGDDSQVDLPVDQRSGLDDAEHLLRRVSDIAVVRLERKDIVRHPLVNKIVTAYEQREQRERGGPGSGRP